jgi:hypothetical protein
MLQDAISKALGIDASHLRYYVMQHVQLSEVLQKQQQPLPALQHAPAHESISSAGAADTDGGSRPPSRGPSPLRGSTASSNSNINVGQLLPVQLPQQPWSVVVGLSEQCCEFSLGRLEEILQGAAAAGGAPARLQESTKQLQVCVSVCACVRARACVRSHKGW